jgi:hypothetical protein
VKPTLSTIAAPLRPHAAFAFYLLSVCWLVFSVFLVSGTRYLGQLELFLVVLLASYPFMVMAVRWLPLEPLLGAVRFAGWRDSAAWILLVLAVALAAGHFVHLGSVPVYDAFREQDYFKVMLIRQNIFDDAGVVWRYAPNMLIKSVLPFLLFYFVSRSLAGFLITLLVGTFYAIATLNKIFIVFLIAPAFIVAALEFDIRRAALMALALMAGLLILPLIQNPQVRPQIWVNIAAHLPEPALSTRLSDKANQPGTMDAEALKRLAEIEGERAKIGIRIDRSSPLYVAFDTIKRRIVDVPGEVITAWFRHIPSKIPFTYGCGYRWLAAIKGCEFRFVPAEINALERPDLAKLGVAGTMTAASFMTDYANFGSWGFVISGLVLALLFAALGLVFRDDWKAAVALTAVPIMLLMEIQLSTVILTGGWFLTVLFYLIWCRSPGGAVQRSAA